MQLVVLKLHLFALKVKNRKLQDEHKETAGLVDIKEDLMQTQENVHHSQ